MALTVLRLKNHFPVVVNRRLVLGLFLNDIKRQCCHGRDIGITVKDRAQTMRRVKKAIFFGYVKYKMREVI